MMYGWYDGGAGVGAWILMAVAMVIFWGGIWALIVFVIRRPQAGHLGAAVVPLHHGAEQVLNERFARGEVDEKEFTARREALRR